MFTNRCLVTSVRVSLVAAALLVTTGIGVTAWAQDCNPACASGQLCVQGTCMVPAAPPAAYPPPPATAYPPPPATAYPPASTYPPAPANTYPPPGYSYPPPNAYAPPPGYYAPPSNAPYPSSYAPPPPPADRRHRGFLAMPFLGINSYQGDKGANLGPGFRLGTLLGGRINEMFSINGELTFDFANPENVPAGVDVTMLDLVLTVSPLYHFIAGNIEVVVGPKFGGHSFTQQQNDTGLGDSKRTWNGYVIGLNGGVFAAVSRGMSLGGLLSLESRTAHEYCFTDPGFAEQCTTNNTGSSFRVLGFMAALLF
jgi:hypothetical protein